jgi:hypothetical protein
MVLGLPESPRYLYNKGRHDEALQVLCDVYDRDGNDEKIVKEQNGILQALSREHAASEYSWRRIFKKDDVQTGKRVLLAYGMQFMNQMGGINAVVYAPVTQNSIFLGFSIAYSYSSYYMPTILEDNVGVSSKTAVLLGAA